MILDDLEIAWRAWADAGAGFSADQWRLPTRLTGWAVRDVYAHHGAFPYMLAGLAAAGAADQPATHATAAALLRSFNEPTGVAHTDADRVRDRAIEDAGNYSSEELLATFARVAPQAITAAREVPLDRLIQYGGRAVLPFGEAVRIGLMEAVVHYLDVARAVGLPVPGPLDGAPVRSVAALVAEVADPLTVVEYATGRSGTDPFPVIR
jgi:uncharacterized protein (TIGR03083 family)